VCMDEILPSFEFRKTVETCFRRLRPVIAPAGVRDAAVCIHIRNTILGEPRNCLVCVRHFPANFVGGMSLQVVYN
jgi:hypothetical protein